MSAAQNFINAINGFNTTEVDWKGDTISFPVRPVVFSYDGLKPVRKRDVKNFQQLKTLMKKGPVDLHWQNDGIAIKLHCLEDNSSGTLRGRAVLHDNNKQFSLSLVTVTMTENLQVPKEVIERIQWLAPRINAVAAAAR